VRIILFKETENMLSSVPNNLREKKRIGILLQLIAEQKINEKDLL
jgi:hypothetical protein